jgi:hypothetical protein
MNRGLPKSIKKHIRSEKARIRREVFNLEEQEKLIRELNKKYFKEDSSIGGPPEGDSSKDGKK